MTVGILYLVLKHPFCNSTNNQKQRESCMKTWCYLISDDKIHGLDVADVFGLAKSNTKPNYVPYDARFAFIRPSISPIGWQECRNDLQPNWCFIDGVYVSPTARNRFETNGPSALPRNPRTWQFRVYNFLGMDNFRVCRINIDIDNHTPDDVAKLLLSHFKAKIDLGITSGGGDPDGQRRYFSSITRLAYTNFAGLALLDKTLAVPGGSRDHYRNLLFAAVTTAHTVAKLDANQKMHLTDSAKLISEYNLDTNHPIVALWALDKAERWNLDWGDIGLDFIADFVTEAIDAAI